jgi:hypothetical protein
VRFAYPGYLLEMQPDVLDSSHKVAKINQQIAMEQGVKPLSQTQVVQGQEESVSRGAR